MDTTFPTIMEIADVRIRIDKVGSDVPKTGVTPAEAVILHIVHQQRNGGSTFGDEMDKIKVTGTAMNGEDERTDLQEMSRLKRIYGGITNKKGEPILRQIFPNNINPVLPQKFSDLKWKEISFDGLEVSAFDYGTSNGKAIS